MAPAEPDVGLLTTSAQIFASNHTLPQIRQMHKALLVQVDDKAARLRTQVGGSYRELMGTADTIVQMRSDMEGAQATLAGMGGRCGRGVVGAKATGLAAFVQHEHGPEGAALRLAARAKLLEACARTVGRLLSRKASFGQEVDSRDSKKNARLPERPQTWGERVVLASKVLVLARLVTTSIDESQTSRPRPTRDAYVSDASEASIKASIDASKRALGGLRRRLRDIVEILERTVPSASSPTTDDAADDKRERRAAAGTWDDLLRALCAHSLATTSGARDLLWQLLHVRSQAMGAAFETDEYAEAEAESGSGNTGSRADQAADRVLRGLALYTRTLLDVQALLPHKLPEALLALKQNALLDDADLRATEALQLDVHAQWCGEDVQYFRPYIRHDDLDAATARAMLGSWAERGSDVLVDGLASVLDQSASATHRLDLDAMVALRTRVLQLWIRDSSRARGIDPGELLGRLRAVFVRQMLVVVGHKAAKLRLVGSEVAATVASWQSGVSGVSVVHASLWAPDVDTELARGAVPFVRDVAARLHGRSDAVAKAAASYATWRHVVDGMAGTVAQLRRQRWDTDAGDVVEDEDTLAARQQALGRQDPEALATHLAESLASAFGELDAQIVAAWDSVAASGASDATKGDVAMYLVRVLREIRGNLPSMDEVKERSIGVGCIAGLHAAMARAVASRPLAQFAGHVLARTAVPGRPLWETQGHARALPTTPSPGVFKFVRDLAAAMGHAGLDLWSPAALRQLKTHVASQLGAPWTARLAEVATELGDEATKAGRLSEARQTLLAQWLFDLAWLRCALGSDAPALAELEQAVYEQSGLSDDGDDTGPKTPRQRLDKSAADYWKKTSLLFGLLT